MIKNNECLNKKPFKSPNKPEEHNNIETIKHKNPFLHIIKLSEKKKKTMNEDNKYHLKTNTNLNNIQATKICHINPIALPNSLSPLYKKGNTILPTRNLTPILHSKPNTPTSPLPSPSPSSPSVSDLQKEIDRLKEIITDKDNKLSIAKKTIDSLIIENLTLKSKVLQYKDKFDMMVNEGNIISKETILFNYLAGVYDEGHNANGEILPNFESMTYEDLLALEEKIGYVSKGFTKEQINKIEKSAYRKGEGCERKENEDKCVICQFDLNEGESVKYLSCEHCYHEKCIDLWLMKEKKCPFCKKEIILA